MSGLHAVGAWPELPWLLVRALGDRFIQIWLPVIRQTNDLLWFLPFSLELWTFRLVSVAQKICSRRLYTFSLWHVLVRFSVVRIQSLYGGVKRVIAWLGMAGICDFYR